MSDFAKTLDTHLDSLRDTLYAAHETAINAVEAERDALSARLDEALAAIEGYEADAKPEPPAWTPGSVGIAWADGRGDIPDDEPEYLTADRLLVNRPDLPKGTVFRRWAYSEPTGQNIEIAPETIPDLPAGAYLVLAQVMAGEHATTPVEGLDRDSENGQPSQRLRRWLAVPDKLPAPTVPATPIKPVHRIGREQLLADGQIMRGPQVLRPGNSLRNVVILAEGARDGLNVTGDGCKLLGSVYVQDTAGVNGSGSAGVVVREGARDFVWEHGGCHNIKPGARNHFGRCQGMYGKGLIDARLGDLLFSEVGESGPDWSQDPDNEYSNWAYLIEAKGLRGGTLVGINCDGGLKLSSDRPGGFSNAEIEAVVSIDCGMVLSFSTTTNGRARFGDHQLISIGDVVGHQIGGPLATQGNAVSAWGIMADGADGTCWVDRFILGACARTFANRNPIEAAGGKPKINVRENNAYGWGNPKAESPFALDTDTLTARLHREGVGPWLLEALR